MTYTVSLSSFSGPLDLLLHLVKQEEVEIHEIPITTICDKYLEYLKSLESLDVDVASEFLVMAATLMLIKSRKLLPQGESIDLEEELDPEDELIQQLLEYKRFKMASRDLGELAGLRARIAPYLPPKQDKGEDEIPLEEIDVWDLVRAFATILKDTGLDRVRPQVLHEDKPLREYVEDLFGEMRARGRCEFLALFAGRGERAEVIGRFLALLELVRRKRLKVTQGGAFDSIDVVLADGRDLTEEEFDVIEVEMGRPGVTEEEEMAREFVAADAAEGEEDPVQDGEDALEMPLPQTAFEGEDGLAGSAPETDDDAGPSAALEDETRQAGDGI